MPRLRSFALAVAALCVGPTAPAVSQQPKPQVLATRDPDVNILLYDSAERFAERLGGQVRTVDFDDIQTPADRPVPFAADRYKEKLGIVITGEGGQYVGRTFKYP